MSLTRCLNRGAIPNVYWERQCTAAAPLVTAVVTSCSTSPVRPSQSAEPRGPRACRLIPHDPRRDVRTARYRSPVFHPWEPPDADLQDDARGRPSRLIGAAHADLHLRALLQ
jgi:hypothetical protein